MNEKGAQFPHPTLSHDSVHVYALLSVLSSK